MKIFFQCLDFLIKSEKKNTYNCPSPSPPTTFSIYSLVPSVDVPNLVISHASTVHLTVDMSELPDYMKVLIKEEEKPSYVYKEIPVPQPGNGELLVKVLKVSICGSDNILYQWDEGDNSIYLLFLVKMWMRNRPFRRFTLVSLKHSIYTFTRCKAQMQGKITIFPKPLCVTFVGEQVHDQG